MAKRRQRLTPEKDASEHVRSAIDKPFLEERFIDIQKGRGVFARVPIESGCFLAEYRGELISQHECSARQNKFSDKEKTFLFDFQWNGGYWCIDASKEDGSMGRLFNDDHKSPNGRMRIILVGGKPHLCLFAIDNIASGSEIRYSYGDCNWPWRTLLPSTLPQPASSTSVETHGSLISEPPANVQIASSPLHPANSKVGEEHRTSFCEVVSTPHIMEVQLPSPLPQPASSTFVETHGSLISEPPANIQVSGDLDISDDYSDNSDYSDKDYIPDADDDSSDSSHCKELNVINPVGHKRARIASHNPKANISASLSCASSEPMDSCSPPEKSLPSVTPMPKGSPTRAKYGRYNKKQFCLYCKKPKSKLARHLEHVHSREPDVAKAFSFDKKSHKRRVLLRILTSRGNFLHNANVSSTGTGEMVARRRPIKAKTADDYKHCIHCQGMYARETLWRHMRYCPLKPETKEPQTGKKRVQSLPYLSLPPPEDVSQAVWKIACEMNNDEVASVVRGERYILLLGQQMYNKSTTTSGRKENIRQKMRELARLVITARSVTPLKNLRDFIMPCNFRYVINAVRSVAGYNEESNLFGIGSLAVKLGHSLKKIANIIQCSALMVGNAEVAESARNFSTIYDKQWNECISSGALNTLAQAKWNKPQVLPFTEDVKKLHSFLAAKQKNAMSALQVEPNSRNFAILSKVTLTQVILFNRRREGEVSKMMMKLYVSRDHTQMHKDIALGLSAYEKKLCDYFQRVEIRGKRGRKVPVLFAPHMVSAIDILIEERAKCGVPMENEYLFARPAALTHYRGADCFREYARACGAENPGTLSSTKLRKQVATLSTMLNMKENELDQLASFLGHDIRIHREFYRLPESTLQLAKVSKILIAMEKGRLPELQGKGLDDIIINPQDEVDMSSGVSSDEEGFSGLHQTQNKMNQGSSSMPHSKDDKLIDSSSDEMEFADLRAMHSERTQGVGRKRSQKNLEKSPDSTLQTTMSHTKPSADVNLRRKWETAEVKAIERHLMDHIRGCKVPGKRQCMSCLLSEPVALKSRNWSSIKYYVNNRIVALKRKMCQ